MIIVLIFFITIFAYSENNNKVQTLFKNFAKKNKKILSIKESIKAAKAKKNAKCIGNAIPIDLRYKHKIGGGGYGWDITTGIGSDVIPAAIAAKNEYKATKMKMLAEAEKISAKYLGKMLIFLQKEELKILTKQYVDDRKKDLEEYTARAKKGLTSKAELSQYQFNTQDVENSYKELSSEIQTLKEELTHYCSDVFDEEANFFITMPEAMDLIDCSKESGTTNSLQAMFKMKHAKAEMYQRMLSTAPFPKIELSFAWETKPKSIVQQRARTVILEVISEPNSMPSLSPFPGIEISLKWKLGPSNFIEIYAAHKEFEAAKLDYAWEQEESNYESAASKNKMLSKKNAMMTAKLGMIAQKDALSTKIAQYEKGFIEYEKIAEARMKYYDSVKKYFDSTEKFIEALVTCMQTCGIIRELIINEVLGKRDKKKLKKIYENNKICHDNKNVVNAEELSNKI